MRARPFTPARASTALAVLICLGPPLAVALRGTGLPMPVAVVSPVALAVLLVKWIPPLPLAAARRHPALAVAWLAVLTAGAVQTSRSSLYALDATRPEYSVVPGDPWRVEHCCFTAYAEAARFAAAGVANVYDPSRYVPSRDNPRHIGPLKVDPFHYPPPFLLLPGAVRAIAPEFFDTRRAWFGLQALTLGSALLAVGWWVGGDRGSRVALLAPLLWATPVTFLSLQMGNFQITAVPLALLGMMLMWSRRDAAGGALLAFNAAGKVFPSMLVLHAFAALRWRAVAWIAAMGIAFSLVTAAIYGIDPFVDFLRDELPRLVSGASFPQTEFPGTMPVNMSVYGMTAKLRLLGATWLDQPTGKHVAQFYALLLAVFVVWAGGRVRAREERGGPDDRLHLAMLWLAILNLAALGGPFVPAMYGVVGTLWILLLLAATAEDRAGFWAWVVLFVILTVATLIIPTPRPREMPAVSMLILSLVTQAGIFGVNIWAASRRVRDVRTASVLSPAPAQAM